MTCFAGSVSASQAGDTVKKMQNLYRNATTYVGTLQVSRKGSAPGGKAFTLTVTTQLKYKKPNYLYLHEIGTATGAASPLNGKAYTTVVNPKLAFKVDEAKHQYVKGPSPKVLPVFGGTQLTSIALTSFDLTSAKLMSTSNVGGHPAYIIQIAPDMSKAPPQFRNQKPRPILLAIAKSNYYLLRIGPPVGNGVVDLSGQSINGSLSDSIFNISPPSGYQDTTGKQLPTQRTPPHG